MKASRANTAGLKCVPVVPAAACPAIILPKYPIAKRTADARARRTDAILILDIGFKCRIGNWSGRHRHCDCIDWKGETDPPSVYSLKEVISSGAIKDSG